ncbi:M16 family metallopeptidase [Rufibacter quisquiliarum]|uniref:Putative Zn-dependent peptidase n=1 Tax=Rufibacter quisquiliarum TaxID=1549639 RepID=A0A839GCR1_9BACT|nr:pitrilysin family protein [Rufibacter quisquiliarum]MBA9076160.1 putative Zn-dependent peptidase [Rufibacter quisquiliarum]
MKRKLLSTLLLGASLTAAAQSNKIDFTEYDLPNGLHVILHQDKTTPTVAVTMMYHVGSKNEAQNRTGFAHFFEHLMFEGSENVERGNYINMIQSAGGAVNANTSFDRTYYYQILPSNQLALGLWMEADRLRAAKIDERGVETQRQVVKEEKKQRIDNQPYGTLLENTFATAFEVHPYRWVPIGSAQYIDKASLREFMDFYKTFYVPNNATLTIAGDLDVEQTKKLVEQYFAPIPKGTIPIIRPSVEEPKQVEEGRKVVFDNIQLPAVVQAYHIPKQGADDSYAIKMLTTLLSGGQSSRLNKALVDNQQKAVTVASIPLSMEDPGLFINLAVANMGVDVHELERAIDAELDRVKKEPISDQEFQKLRNQIETEYINGLATLEGRTEKLASFHALYGNTNLINTELDKLLAVTKDDLMRVANQYLTKENRAVLHYLPKAAQAR